MAATIKHSAGAKLRVRAVLRMALASRLNRLIERQQTQEAVDGVRTARAQHVLGEVGGLCLVYLEELRPACGVLQRRPAAPDVCLQRGASAARSGYARTRLPSMMHSSPLVMISYVVGAPSCQ